MYLEFLIAGLTSFFLWLLLRHMAAFRRDRMRQRAGQLLQEAQLPLKRAILAAAVQLSVLLLLCGYFLAVDYLAFFVTFGLSDNVKYSMGGYFADSSVFLDVQCLVGVFFLMSIGSRILGRGKRPFASRIRLSFAIHENGIVYEFVHGNLVFLPWESIEYMLWSPTRKKFFLQRKGHLSFLRSRFSVDDGDAVAEILSRFVEVRGWEGKVQDPPNRTPETRRESPATKTSHWRSYRFQFDLLSLMLLTLVIASAASWYAYHQHRLQPIKAAVASLAEFQPMVSYHDVDVQYLLFWGNGKKPGDADLVALRAFPQLEALEFSGAPAITDAGLAEVERLSRLQALDLLGTSITDAGLLRLQNLAELRELNLMGTAITDVGLSNLKPLSGLRILYLSSTKITDAGLIHLRAFPQLEKLYLPGAGITDSAMNHLSALKNLRHLHLGSGAKVTDAGLASLRPLEQLEELDLDGTQITDAGLPNLYGLTKLKSLNLRSTQVTPSGVALLKQALPKTEIQFTPPAAPLAPSSPNGSADDSETPTSE
jgi:uncharacterized membrane protein